MPKADGFTTLEGRVVYTGENFISVTNNDRTYTLTGPEADFLWNLSHDIWDVLFEFLESAYAKGVEDGQNALHEKIQFLLLAK